MADTYSRAALRAAIAAYLSTGIGGTVPYLATVTEHAALIMPTGDIASPNPVAGNAIGAGLWLKLETSHSRRIALGKRMKSYRVVMDIILLAMTGDSADAEEANDAMLDGLEELIGADRTAGTGVDGTGTGVVWQWGEGEGPMGGTDIDIACGYPVSSGNQRIEMRSRVTVTAQQEGTS